LGITGHEASYLAERYDRELQPGIYVSGLGGFRHCDSILIDEQGCVTLTQAPDTLGEMILEA
jgi:Xaa-Pro dipeptidase